MHELNHGAAGKGDKERSPGWRDNYNEIQNFRKNNIPGLQQIGVGRFRKVYPGAGEPAHMETNSIPPGIALENLDTGEIEYHTCQCDICRDASDMPLVSPDQNGDGCGCRVRPAQV